MGHQSHKARKAEIRYFLARSLRKIIQCVNQIDPLASHYLFEHDWHLFPSFQTRSARSAPGQTVKGTKLCGPSRAMSRCRIRCPASPLLFFLVLYRSTTLSCSIILRSHLRNSFLATTKPHLHRRKNPCFQSYHASRSAKMPSSKGEPTDPELRERVKEEVKAEEKGMFLMSPSCSCFRFFIIYFCSGIIICLSPLASILTC